MNKKIIVKNKKAYFDYEILDSFEAGIVLIGSEVKSVKAGHVQLKGSYVSIKDSEVSLVGAHISAYKPGEQFEAERPRKLLLNKKEIDSIYTKLKTTGVTVVPTEIYLKNNYIKVEISIARGKKKYDKRETQKKKDIERQIRQKYKGI